MAFATIRYRTVDIEVADEPPKDICFVFGVRKSGSSILNNVVHAIAKMNDVHFVDIAGQLFQNGIPVRDWQRDAGMGKLLKPGNVYGGFRNFPLGLTGDETFRNSKKLLMVRDPRDALVSEYFSNAYSHSVPVTGKTRNDMLALRDAALGSEIDAYVLKMAPLLRNTLREYMQLGDHNIHRTLRYEDVITRKRLLLSELCGFFSWSLSETQSNQILGWADVVPETEQPTEFVRKVTPGDYLEKLSRETISKLNDLFAAEMQYFGYGQSAAE